MHYIRNWPEGLFILLVMVAPFVVAVIWSTETLLGFLGRLAPGMVAGVIVWIGIVGAAAVLHDRRKH
jgi:hypothetical protein